MERVASHALAAARADPLGQRACAATYNGNPKDTLSPVVTTSSVLGLKYKDGIIMAADTVACYGKMARYKDVERFFSLGKHTAVSTSGDFSDYQMLRRVLSQYALKDFLLDDQCPTSPHGYAALLSRLMYQKRSRMNPWWLNVVIAGYQPAAATAAAAAAATDAAAVAVDVADAAAQDPKKKSPFVLGYVDMHGTYYEDDIVATGMGRYFGMTLLRERYTPNMSEQEARKLLEDCMRLLFYRDCAASNKIQMTKITEEGVSIEQPSCISSKWCYKCFTDKTTDMGLAGCAW